MKKAALTIIFGCIAAFGYADVADDARALIDAGDTQAARDVLAVALDQQQKPAVLAKLNALMGECFVLEGEFAQARPYLQQAKAKNQADAFRWLGYLDFLVYNYPSATANYAQYHKLLKAAKKTASAEVADEQRRLRLGEEFLENVEKIQIIDSISVARDGFFKAYRLPASAGFLNPPSVIPLSESAEQATMAFSNESGELMLWAEPDSLGTMRIAESMRLTDGSWTHPQLAPEELNDGGDADYPFLLSDGQTLYFASDGDGSLGGYDIFVAMRDANTGEYLQPRNIGMPYNSPFDDYMFAIDEENGIGWWATDRNQLDGLVTIYVFIPNDIRENINAEEVDPEPFARIDRFEDTWTDPDLVEKKRRDIASITNEGPKRKADFLFPMGKGVVYTTLDDFSAAGRRMMQAYMEAEDELADAEEKLSEARRSSNPSALQISELEKQVTRLRANVFNARNNVYRAEGKK